jgi:hypothetical protein
MIGSIEDDALFLGLRGFDPTMKIYNEDYDHVVRMMIMSLG